MQKASNLFTLPNRQVEYDGNNMYDGLRHELGLYIGRGKRLSTLSTKCCGHPTASTISRIAYGDTKEPRMSTVVMLFYALGFSMIVHQTEAYENV